MDQFYSFMQRCARRRGTSPWLVAGGGAGFASHSLQCLSSTRSFWPIKANDVKSCIFMVSRVVLCTFGSMAPGGVFGKRGWPPLGMKWGLMAVEQLHAKFFGRSKPMMLCHVFSWFHVLSLARSVDGAWGSFSAEAISLSLAVGFQAETVETRRPYSIPGEHEARRERPSKSRKPLKKREIFGDHACDR
jgi:hypothetical protein